MSPTIKARRRDAVDLKPDRPNSIDPSREPTGRRCRSLHRSGSWPRAAAPGR
ncbi:hypothetical protein A33M_3540 [Rhodovulum sp. PH10]|nr:hypothetical protein A33M_3540 [Rhodovulum sp. PH10]